VPLAARGTKKPASRRALEIDFGVEHRGFEPRTPCLPGKCSPAELMPREPTVYVSRLANANDGGELLADPSIEND
jgi:hypothetical protein